MSETKSDETSPESKLVKLARERRQSTHRLESLTDHENLPRAIADMIKPFLQDSDLGYRYVGIFINAVVTKRESVLLFSMNDMEKLISKHPDFSGKTVSLKSQNGNSGKTYYAALTGLLDKHLHIIKVLKESKRTKRSPAVIEIIDEEILQYLKPATDERRLTVINSTEKTPHASYAAYLASGPTEGLQALDQCFKDRQDGKKESTQESNKSTIQESKDPIGQVSSTQGLKEQVDNASSQKRTNTALGAAAASAPSWLVQASRPKYKKTSPSPQQADDASSEKYTPNLKYYVVATVDKDGLKTNCGLFVAKKSINNWANVSSAIMQRCSVTGLTLTMYENGTYYVNDIPSVW